MRKRAYAGSRSMTWQRTASRYVTVFESLRRIGGAEISVVRKEAGPSVTNLPPPVSLDHLELMCDDTGLLQHAIHCVPDRLHGYCVDDNARALLLASALNVPGEIPMAERSQRPLRGIRPTCLERRTKAVPQFHELRPALARRRRLRGLPCPVALGPGGMRAQRSEHPAPTMGERAVPRSTARRGDVRLAAGVVFHADGPGRIRESRDRKSLPEQSPPIGWWSSCYRA